MQSVASSATNSREWLEVIMSKPRLLTMQNEVIALEQHRLIHSKVFAPLDKITNIVPGIERSALRVLPNFCLVHLYEVI